MLSSCNFMSDVNVEVNPLSLTLQLIKWVDCLDFARIYYVKKKNGQFTCISLLLLLLLNKDKIEFCIDMIVLCALCSYSTPRVALALLRLFVVILYITSPGSGDQLESSQAEIFSLLECKNLSKIVSMLGIAGLLAPFMEISKNQYKIYSISQK